MSESAIRRIVVRKGETQTRLERVRLRERGPVRLRTLVTGIDGTDEELLASGTFEPPSGQQYLVLGHEALAQVESAPHHASVKAGDLVVPLVRRGCGSCQQCRQQAPDFCPSGDYREHGIKELHGFMRDVWSDRADHLVRVPAGLQEVAVLTEPLSVVVKAFAQAATIQRRLPWFEARRPFEGARALVLGTGSLGSLAAILLRTRGLEVVGVDRHDEGTAAARLLRHIGASHVNVKKKDLAVVASEKGGFDLIVETTGVPKVLAEALPGLAGNGVATVLGIPGEGRRSPLPWEEHLRSLVLGNQVLFGSVNSNRSHFEEALRVLRRAKRQWPRLAELVLTHRYGPDDHAKAFRASGTDLVKKAIDWGDPS